VAAVVKKGLILSLAAVVILLFTGRKGWEMVYRRRVGVLEEEWGPGATTLKARRRTSAAE
jgi:uncharacterized membrane protein